MNTNSDEILARLNALQAIVLDMLALAATEEPRLYPVIRHRLAKIAEDFADIEDVAEAQIVRGLTDEFTRAS